jgi:hypothetical protein
MKYDEDLSTKIYNDYLKETKLNNYNHKINLLNKKYFSELEIDCKITLYLEVCSAPYYSISFDIGDYLFVILDGEEEEIPQMIENVENLLNEKKIVEYISKKGININENGIKNLYRKMNGITI